MAPFLDVIAGHALSDIWKRADNFENGAGLKAGVHWDTTLRLHKRLMKTTTDAEQLELMAMEEDQTSMALPDHSVSWLELFLTGGFWTNDRAFRAGLTHDRSCPRCGFHTETALHMLWTCPKNKLISSHAVQSTQVLQQQAIEGSAQHACLWLRGLLPLDLLQVNTPIPDSSLLRLFFQFIQPHEWPSGAYHTDASGGENNEYPLIRRCGIGIVRLNFFDLEPNKKQIKKQ